MTDILRLFIAIALPDGIKRVLQTQQDFLKSQLASGIRWTTKEQWHLTLVFLGATNREKLETIQAAMQRATRGLNAFELTTGTLGAFPSLRRPSVLWSGVGGQLGSLRQLHVQLSEELTGLFEPEVPFKPHLTLARLSKFGLGARVMETFSHAPSTAEQRWLVEEVGLYSSLLKPSGAEYQLLHTVKLPSANRHHLARDQLS